MGDRAMPLVFGLLLGIMVLLLAGPEVWAFPHHDGFQEYSDSFKKLSLKFGDDDGWNNGWSGYSGSGNDYGDSKGWSLEKDWKDSGEEKESGWKKFGWKNDEKYDPECDPPVPTPEPTTLVLFGASLGGLTIARRVRRRAGF